MDEVDQVMQEGLSRRVFPGAVLQVFAGGRTRFERAYGMADLFSARPMQRNTCFDLASLTKPLATVLAVMTLVKQGALDLNATCGALYSEVRGSDKADITLAQLLNHSSGLPPWRPFFMELRHLPQSRRWEMLRKRLLETALAAQPGSRSDYSDLGYLLLQWLVEMVSGQNLDCFVENEIYAPLGIEDLFFNDATRLPADVDRYAATQFCPWRNRLLVGQVDDDNAFVVGGRAGHAGLFGTAESVCRLLQALLKAVHGDREGQVFDADLVRLFFTAPANRRWALGFDTPSPQGSSAGKYFPSRSVGHLGFTGTSFWMDWQKGVGVVLLTNRVHPWRFNQGIKSFRPVLHDAVMRAL